MGWAVDLKFNFSPESAVMGPEYTARVGILHLITVTVNGTPMTATVESRRSLLDCLRDDFHLHGTHVGCEHGACGCCNVILDGEVVRSCLVFAAQVDGSSITTVEGLETSAGLS